MTEWHDSRDRPRVSLTTNGQEPEPPPAEPTPTPPPPFPVEPPDRVIREDRPTPIVEPNTPTPRR